MFLTERPRAGKRTVGRARDRALTWVVLLGVLGAIATGCADGPAPSGPAPGEVPVLIVGIDGLEWNVVLPLIHEGRMPHLESLMARGSYGTLETYAPAMSPVIWTTIATGKTPDKHGIVDFTWNDVRGDKHLFSSGDRRTKALWNIVSDSGQRALFVGWWNTYPAEPIDGVIVSQANTLEQIAARRLLKPGGMLRGESRQVHPTSLMDEVWNIVEEVDFELPQLREEIFGSAARPRWPGDRANFEACTWSIRADESMRRVAIRLLEQAPLPDVSGVYFGLPDVVGHRFWRYHEPDAFEHPPSDEAIDAFGQVVRDSYARADAIVGELVERVGETTNILVVSDHGIHAQNRASQFDVPVHGRLERESGGHEDGPPGLFVAAGPNFRQVSTTVSIRGLEHVDLPRIGRMVDIAPTILALRGIPVGRDMDGEVLTEVLAGDSTSAFQPAYVATHDTAEWLASRGQHVQEAPGTAERLEQLRSLGYIGDPGEDSTAGE